MHLEHQWSNVPIQGLKVGFKKSIRTCLTQRGGQQYGTVNSGYMVSSMPRGDFFLDFPRLSSLMSVTGLILNYSVEN